MALVGTEGHGSGPWDRASGHGCPQVLMAAVGIRLVCLIMGIFTYIHPRNILHVNINGIMIIRDSMNHGDKGVADVSAKQ